MRLNRTIICWLLAITLAWLPLTASAEVSTLSTSSAPCHETSADSHKKAPELVSIVHSSTFKSTCCNDCGDCNSSTEISGCNSKTGQIPSFIVTDKNITQYLQLIQTDTKQPAQYHSLTSSPDIRPPIV